MINIHFEHNTRYMSFEKNFVKFVPTKKTMTITSELSI